MIVLFTSNEAGGILQFVIQMVNTLTKMNYSVRAFIPEGATVTVTLSLEDKVIFYKKKKTINRFDKSLRSLSEKMISMHPDIVWFFDDTIHSAEISLLLGERVKQILTMHDGGEIHSTNARGVKQVVRRYLEKHMVEKCLENVDKVLLLSGKSKNTFIDNYPSYKEKTIVLNLGAHVPDIDGRELDIELPHKYFLFFGRIDKYKGIFRLLKAYKKYDGKVGLVIAGKGNLTTEEQMEIDTEDRCILINRYISDEEIIWLFENTYALVLPYIDATQSGIIPISYKYGKPVIVSNVEGLTQFVDDRRTGYICRSEDDYVKAFKVIETNPTSYRKACEDYYRDNLEWESNIGRLFQQLGDDKPQIINE